MSMSTAIKHRHLVLNDLIQGVEDVMRTGKFSPWQVVFASLDEVGVNRAFFNVRRVTSSGKGIFRAEGDIDGREATVVFHCKQGVPSALYAA